MQTVEQQLQAPFPDTDIEWRVQQAGIDKNGQPWAMVLAYITNRAIQARLDDVFGFDGWQNQYKDGPNGLVECGISVWSDDRKQWVTKWDAAENTDIEAVKGGRSNAMKRCAVQLGMGRYLYQLDTKFALCYPEPRRGQHSQKFHSKKTGETIYGSWDNPDLPEWALPK